MENNLVCRVCGSKLNTLHHPSCPVGQAQEDNEMHDEMEMDMIGQDELYVIDNQILNFIHKNFPSIQIKCNSTIFIEQLLLQYNTDSATIYASIKNNMFEICVIENNKLEFHNFFSVETKEDILYFLLFTIEHVCCYGYRYAYIYISS